MDISSNSSNIQRHGNRKFLGITLLLSIVQLQIFTSIAFSTTSPIISTRISTQKESALKVSTLPDKNDYDDGISPQPLFDMTDVITDDTFQINDLYDDDEDYDEDDDLTLDIDAIDVDYDLGYDFDDDDDDLYTKNIKDLDTNIYSNIQSQQQKMSRDDGTYARDEDDILTEREDRFYVNELGETLQREKCILIGVENLASKRKAMQSLNSKDPSNWQVYFDLDQSMDEMKELIATAGLELAGVITQRLNEVNPKTYIGTGKVKEAQELLNEISSCTVVFDAELTPGQQKALENAFNKEVIQNDFMGSETAVSISSCELVYLLLQLF